MLRTLPIWIAALTLSGCSSAIPSQTSDPPFFGAARSAATIAHPLPSAADAAAPAALGTLLQDVDDDAPPTFSYPEHWRQHGVDHAALPELLLARGFEPGVTFRAFVLEITFSPTLPVVIGERAFDWDDTSARIWGWNPGSTVKVFAAAAALSRLHQQGFTPDAVATFRGRQEETWSMTEIIHDAITKSGNMSYNRLVQLAGYDWLNEHFFDERSGPAASAINGAYEISNWRRRGESKDLSFAPAIAVQEGERLWEREPAQGVSTPRCAGSACTHLQDLAEVMRRIGLHERLPPEQRLLLGDPEIALLRQALAAQRKRGMEAVDALRAGYGRGDLFLMHKPGFAENWFSDLIYLEDREAHSAWVIVLAARRGRNGLDQGARILGEVLANGELALAEHRPGLRSETLKSLQVQATPEERRAVRQNKKQRAKKKSVAPKKKKR